MHNVVYITYVQPYMIILVINFVSLILTFIISKTKISFFEKLIKKIESVFVTFKIVGNVND